MGQVAAIVALGTLFLLAMGLAVVLYATRAQRRLLQQRMDTQSMELRYQQELVAKNLQVQEAERQRIATHLHDDIGSKLGVLNLSMHHLNRQTDDPEKQRETFREMEQLIALTMQSVRNISHELLPPTLEDFGLCEALKELLEPVRKTTTINVQLECTITRSDVAQGQHELHLFRIVQEMLSNSLKHGAPTAIHIALKRENNRTALFYRDNGRGFDLDSVQRRGLGLKNLESRARMIGASATLESKPGAGFSARFVL